MASGLPPLHGRHRDKKGGVSQKHGNTLIGTLRKTYGQHFATRCDDVENASDVLHKMDEPSLMALVLDTPGLADHVSQDRRRAGTTAPLS